MTYFVKYNWLSPDVLLWDPSTWLYEHSDGCLTEFYRLSMAVRGALHVGAFIMAVNQWVVSVTLDCATPSAWAANPKKLWHGALRFLVTSLYLFTSQPFKLKIIYQVLTKNVKGFPILEINTKNVDDLSCPTSSAVVTSTEKEFS